MAEARVVNGVDGLNEWDPQAEHMLRFG